MTPNPNIIPADFNAVDVTTLQTALNTLSDSGTKWRQIEVTGVYDVMTESALVNALFQLGKDAVLNEINGGV